MLSFNKPYLTGKETFYIADAVARSQISGDGDYTKKCHFFFENRYGFKKVLLTSSCTDALEMAAILCEIKKGDEVIVPSFTFVSSVNPFVMQGATIIYADVQANHPCIDHEVVAKLITSKTKAIVITHYAGVACNMDALTRLAKESNIFLIEDAAHAIDSTYNGKPLGSFGHMATFSFHETKNIMSGEGGMLVINRQELVLRAEIIREKGTNRTQFYRGEVQKYEWLDIGSSFLPSDITAAFLFAQTEHLDEIQDRRKYLWQKYFDGFKKLAKDNLVALPFIPDYAVNNGHIFYLICKSYEERTALIEHLNASGVKALFHYVPLHTSPFSLQHVNPDPPILPNTVFFHERLVRLPLFFELTSEQQNLVIKSTEQFFYGK